MYLLCPGCCREKEDHLYSTQCTYLLVPEKSNGHTGTLVFFWGKFPSLDDTPKKYIYILFDFYKGFLWKKCAKVARFWGNHLWDCHIETVSSRRLPKHNRILKFSYFALSPMLKIWLIPLVHDHQFLPPDKPKRKETSSTHGKDFCVKKIGAKVTRFWEKKFRNCHIETVSSSRFARI